jgi:4-diphosphocytidyl-2-C-methyl-D-erythritol kinase
VQTPSTFDAFSVKSYAKINLFLHVTGRREDGYHFLETIFQFLNIEDTLTFRPASSHQVNRIDEHEFDIPANDLIIQAATLLKSQSDNPNLPGVDITLKKRIPPGTGMGGGSSNAASTLIALNRIWKLGKSRDQLLELAIRLGADVPVFVHARSCWATGIGDILKPFTPKEKWYCIYIPEVSVSTAKIFSDPKLTRNHPHVSMDDYPSAETTNDLEAVTRNLFGEVDDAFKLLSKYGNPRMNGSGSSVFIACKSKTHALSIKGALPTGSPCLVARSLNTIEY